MPAYPWLGETKANSRNDIQYRMRALQKVGHPYSEEDVEAAPAQLEDLLEVDVVVMYLQSLGTAIGAGATP